MLLPRRYSPVAYAVTFQRCADCVGHGLVFVGVANENVFCHSWRHLWLQSVRTLIGLVRLLRYQALPSDLRPSWLVYTLRQRAIACGRRI
jgi:hypothetical protein